MQQVNMDSSTYHSISPSAAERVCQMAITLATEMNIAISVAVVDNSGHLQHFTRSDAAQFLTIDIAINKAWTASAFSLATHHWNEMVQSKELAPLANMPRFVALAGGYPLTTHQDVIGAIGISGGSPQQDQSLAEGVLTKLGFSL